MEKFKKVALSFTQGERYSFLGKRLTKPQWYVAAAVVGGLLLMPLGGLGIAAFGGAIGIGWWVIGAIVGFFVARDRLRGN